MSTKSTSPRARAAREVAHDTVSGEQLREFYDAKATEYGIELEPDDTVLIDRAVAALDRVRRLERVIASEGEVTIGASGSPKAHPAVAMLNRQDALLAKMIALLGLRLDMAAGISIPRGPRPGSTVTGMATRARRGTPMRRRA